MQLTETVKLYPNKYQTDDVSIKTVQVKWKN